MIGLVSPASAPTPRDKIEKSVAYLEKLGYRVTVGDHASAEYGYLAGTDPQRAADLNQMIRDPEVKAIFALRGGYGSPRILSLIDYASLRRLPKIISGFSDLTALQLALYRRCRIVTFSGPMPAVEFWKDPDPYTEENFWRLLTSSKKIGELRSAADLLEDGRGEGVMLGGNLSLVVACLGTRYLPAMRNSILVLEEVDEAPYRVDRMLMQLVNSGIAGRLSGLILGQFTRCEPKDPSKPHLAIGALFEEFAKRVPGPVLANFQYGHVPKKVTLPLGLRAEIIKGKVRIGEAAVT